MSAPEKSRMDKEKKETRNTDENSSALASVEPESERLGEENVPASNVQPPTTSPPSSPSPQDGSSASQSSPPPSLASPPPKPPRTSPLPTPPSSPPPAPSSLSPPPSPPQPPPQSTPVSVPSKPSSPPPSPLLPPPPPIIPEQRPEPDRSPPEDPKPTPLSPSVPSTPSLSPLSPVDSVVIMSPPLSSPSPPVIPQSPNFPGSPFSPPDTPTEGSTPRPSSSLLPPSNPLSGSGTDYGNSNQQNVTAGNGSSRQNNGSYNEKTLVGIGIAAAIVIVFLVIVFLVRRRKNKRVAQRPKQQYMPPANFSVRSDGYNYYGQKAGKNNNSEQNSSTGNSSGSQRPGGTPDSAVIGTSKTFFTYEELSQMTGGFSKKNIIGEGGFGYVYRGFLSDGKIVAVKQLKSVSGQGYREFKAEVEIISRVHHRHLVSLVGYCISEQHRLLVYEFVPNKTLEYHLHSKGSLVLDWPKRVKIAIGAAKGLAYLHEDCHPKIIHRDIKSANILLDDDFEAQVADFGLARLNDTSQSHVSTRVMGTFGYLAPEYASSGKLTDRSDVFSFGVVLLELITGRKPVDPTQPLGEESLVEWARPHLIEAIETGDVSELVDPRLEKHYVEKDVYRMIETAASCVRHSAPKRPRMVQVVRALDSEGEMSDLTNGVKVGQSTAYDSSQYSEDIRNFRRMNVASDDFSDSGTSGDYYATSHEYTSHDSESRALNNSRRR